MEGRGSTCCLSQLGTTLGRRTGTGFSLLFQSLPLTLPPPFNGRCDLITPVNSSPWLRKGGRVSKRFFSQEGVTRGNLTGSALPLLFQFLPLTLPPPFIGLD